MTLETGQPFRELFYKPEDEAEEDDFEMLRDGFPEPQEAFLLLPGSTEEIDAPGEDIS